MFAYTLRNAHVSSKRCICIMGVLLAISTTMIVLLLIYVPKAEGQQCSVNYSSEGKPLLFGGVSSGCKEGCQPRTADKPSDWGNVCSFDPNGQVWGICTAEQAKNSFELAKQLSGGDILKLSPCDLVPYLRGRTLWLLGDSHTKTFYRALQCFLYDYWDQQECKISTKQQDVQDFLKLPAADGISNCFHLKGDGGGRICIIQVALATALVNSTEVLGGGVLPLLRDRLAQPQDIFYINVGTWHRKTPAWGAAYPTALENLGQYYQSTQAQWPHMLFRETPAIHPADTARNICMPLEGYDYNSTTRTLSIQPSQINSTNMWMNAYGLNKAVHDILPKYQVHVVPAFNISAELVDNHVGMRNTAALDCLHYCQPGMPETWIWYMYEAMRQGAAQIKPLLPFTLSVTPSSRQARMIRHQIHKAGQFECAISTLRM